jgi:hypothetical protein
VAEIGDGAASGYRSLQVENSALIMIIVSVLWKESINELMGLNLGHLVPENGRCVKNWAPKQGGGPNLGRWLSQIWANTWLVQACSDCQDLLRLAQPQAQFT